MAQPEIIKDIDARVKKSGDTMTGKLYTTSNLHGSLGSANTQGAFRIDGGTSYEDGAFLSLHGANSTYYPNGAFQLVASDGTTRKELFGDTTGILKWDNNIILHTNNFSGYALPLSGGTMSGWINFASIASWPTVSGETYPINSNGLYWVGSSDWARIFYRVSASDTGNLVVQLGDDTNCNFIIENSAGAVYSTINNRGVSGAVWNDYAEYRESDITQPGRCIIENGDDTLRLSTERLQRGAEIVSDTFGFAIGETDTCKTPIAASGRVLAYGYEDREQFKSHIGYPVCSGPNGTVSIMTDEEEQLYPSRIIGYISAVPDYEIWGTGSVKVDGRIWIRIK